MPPTHLPYLYDPLNQTPPRYIFILLFPKQKKTKLKENQASQKYSLIPIYLSQPHPERVIRIKKKKKKKKKKRLQMQEESWELSVSPSFNSYSSDKLVDIAAKVTREFGYDDEGGEYFDENEDDEFEFVSVCKAEDDVVVLNGQIGPVFPVFNRDLLSDHHHVQSQEVKETKGQDLKKQEDDHDDHDLRSLRIPLKKLFIEEHDPTSYSSSSSEVDDLEGVPPGTYCVWTPQNSSNSNSSSAKASPSKCKKSKSTGTASSSSKRWRFMNLLRRSNSEGKDSFVFLTPKKEEKADEEEITEQKEKEKEKKPQVVVKKGKDQTVSSAHEVFYGRNRKEGDKRRTYLPYRQDLVGFWASVGNLGRTFPPF